MVKSLFVRDYTADCIINKQGVFKGETSAVEYYILEYCQQATQKQGVCYVTD